MGLGDIDFSGLIKFSEGECNHFIRKKGEVVPLALKEVHSSVGSADRIGPEATELSENLLVDCSETKPWSQRGTKARDRS